MATSATDAMSILDFSWPEVKDSSFEVLPFNNNPSAYAKILKQLIKLFIEFMIDYVRTNVPVDVKLVEEFLKEMANIWGKFSHGVLTAAGGWIGPRSFDPVWNVDLIKINSASTEEMKKANMSFREFSRKFYKIVDEFKYNGKNVDYGTIMNDLNKLICIVLLGGYGFIDYYIDHPADTQTEAQVKMEHDVMMIDRRAKGKSFSQMGHEARSNQSLF